MDLGQIFRDILPEIGPMSMERLLQIVHIVSARYRLDSTDLIFQAMATMQDVE